MEYISYDKYKEIGGVLEPSAFDRYSIRAFSYVALMTHKRIDKMETVPAEVMHLCRDLIEYMHNNVNVDKAVASESQSQGGSSESVSYIKKTISDVDEETNALVYNYLASVTDDKGTPLLYRGCCDVK